MEASTPLRKPEYKLQVLKPDFKSGYRDATPAAVAHLYVDEELTVVLEISRIKSGVITCHLLEDAACIHPGFGPQVDYIRRALRELKRVSKYRLPPLLLGQLSSPSKDVIKYFARKLCKGTLPIKVFKTRIMMGRKIESDAYLPIITKP